MSVPNDQDPLWDGRTSRRLTWKMPIPLARTKTIGRPRDKAAWEQVCTTTCFKTGQLLGEVGTHDNPWFTYEEAAHNQRSRTDLELHVGRDIPTEENSKLSQASGAAVDRLRKAVEESKLPQLPRGVLHTGWDAWSRPWALMDCPAEKVPGVTSTNDHHRVTIAVLVWFPHEPLYFPDAGYLHWALQNRI